MLMWLYELIIGRKSCQHEFEIYQERALLRNSAFGKGSYRYGTQYDLKCKKCGIIKAITT
jgi:hypothetical protein